MPQLCLIHQKSPANALCFLAGKFILPPNQPLQPTYWPLLMIKQPSNSCL